MGVPGTASERSAGAAAGDRGTDLCAAIEGQLGVLAGRADVVSAACAELEALATARPEPSREILRRLAAAVAGARCDAPAALVLDLLGRLADTEATPEILPELLAARSAALRAGAVELAVERLGAGADEALLSSLACALEGSPKIADPAFLGRLAGLLEHRPELLEPDRPASLRHLAARVRDRRGEPAPPDLARRVLGEAVYPRLAPYLDFTRAGAADLVALTPRRPPPCLEPVSRAEAVLGRTELARLIGELGWARVAWGLEVSRRVGLAVGGGLPLVVEADEAALLARVPGVRPIWERWLAVARGSDDRPGWTATVDRTAVDRFRRCNLLHSEVLAELMTMAPLDGRRARRLIDMVARLADDFAALFAGADDVAERAPAVAERLIRPLAAALEGVDDDQPAPAAVAHAVLAFEDPERLDDVTSLHGLKRLLHQRGLKAAFRRFRGASGADRTVDLAVWETGQPMAVSRRLRYVDVEAGQEDRLPLVVALATESYGRHLLHGLDQLPHVEAFCYGNEIQAYINFRNHPAFLRVDLAPPLRGGMLDLEYFAVSQYEIDSHPDLELPAIRAAFAAFDLDLEVDGVRLHARYDKERALELGQLVARVAEVLCLVPYLMDLDWTIAGLDYPPPARLEVAKAWASRLRAWGVLPVEQLLTADRRRVLEAVEHSPAGRHEVPWDGRGPYRDHLQGGPPDDLLDRLRAAVDRLGLAAAERWPEGGPWQPGQLALERTVLEPLRDAVRSGWLTGGAGGLRRSPPELARRDHEAVALAELLSGGGEGLRRSLATGRLVRAVEPHLRFRTTGAVAGHPVDEARVWLSTGPATVVALRDAGGAARLAIAFEGGLLVHRRDDADGPWRLAGEIGPDELERRLRRDAYPVPPPGPLEEASAVAAELGRRRPGAADRPGVGERSVPAIAAAPGRAAGPVRLGTAGRTPDGLDDAVLVAASVAPADAPYLQHAAAIVSTGGGVLSHAGLIALELGRPSVVVTGRWRDAEHGPAALLLRREEHRDELREVGGLAVVCHRGLRVSDEEVRDGDLVEVDADRGRLVLLGRDPEALTAWAAVREVRRLGALLAASEADDAAVLERRGRLLRAVHQLERLAERMTSPTLVRFLVWELLVELPGAAGAPARPAVRRVLAALQRSPGAGGAAHTATAWCLAELERRLADALVAAGELIAGARTPYEPLLGRASVVRLATAVRESAALAGTRPVAELEGELDGLDRELGEYLGRQRLVAVAELAAGDRDPARLRPAIARLGAVERILPTPPELAARIAAGRARLAAADAATRTRHRDARLLDGEELGLESTGEVGGKAAALGELRRVLGSDRVPAFFAVTWRAFREVLASPAGDGGKTLEALIRDALATHADDPGAASEAIRALWERAALPAALETELAERVDALEAERRAEVAFAVRSSGLEEDSSASAWAGQFDTFLGVVGATEVLRSLRLAWAGLWTERAVARRGPGAGLPGGGVVVQRMVASRVSGVVHTAAIAAGRPDEMVINVGLGLGEGVVAGTVDVDHVVVAKTSVGGAGGMRFRYTVGDKREQVVADPQRPGATRRRPALAHQRLRPALEYRELETLVGIALELENAWGEPLDIEFAFEGPELRVLQARPVPAVHAAVTATVAARPLGWRNP